MVSGHVVFPQLRAEETVNRAKNATGQNFVMQLLRLAA
jgi:hypothetical protein